MRKGLMWEKASNMDPQITIHHLYAFNKPFAQVMYSSDAYLFHIWQKKIYFHLWPDS